MERQVHLVRHGETEWNKVLKAQGSQDIPLSYEGEQQVKKLAESLGDLELDRIITSPLLRARKSAKLISEHLGTKPVVIYEGLKERHLGEFEGQFVMDLRARYGDQWQLTTPMGGESNDDFKTRIVETFNQAISDYPDESLLFVCHGWVIGILDSHLAPHAEEKRDGYAVQNATLYTYSLAS